MTWSDIKERLKSPVVVIQIILDVAIPTWIAFAPNMSAKAAIIASALTVLYNIFAGLNNPKDKVKF